MIESILFSLFLVMSLFCQEWLLTQIIFHFILHQFGLAWQEFDSKKLGSEKSILRNPTSYYIFLWHLRHETRPWRKFIAVLMDIIRSWRTPHIVLKDILRSFDSLEEGPKQMDACPILSPNFILLKKRQRKILHLFLPNLRRFQSRNNHPKAINLPRHWRQSSCSLYQQQHGMFGKLLSPLPFLLHLPPFRLLLRSSLIWSIAPPSHSCRLPSYRPYFSHTIPGCLILDPLPSSSLTKSGFPTLTGYVFDVIRMPHPSSLISQKLYLKSFSSRVFIFVGLDGCLLYEMQI